MPELPDILAYLDALRPRVVGQPLRSIVVKSPFVLRTVEPGIDECEGKAVRAIDRIGKRFVFELEDDLFIVVHLMIAGRWRWAPAGPARPIAKVGLAVFRFDKGVLHLVESSKEKRASVHVHRGRDGLAIHDRGGVDVLTCPAGEFAGRLRAENHTVKRALTDPRLFDGIGNAYSDEILHAAGLSPVRLTSKLTDDEIARLFEATRRTLRFWTEKLRAEFAGRFPGPGEITAFRPDFAVHGKFGQPCPVCRTKVQRIRYADNETNYCPRRQTNGTVLADRSLSRLLKSDWPRSVEEWESQR